MTIIQRSASAFTDQTLPRLLSDPVWNEAGGRVLFDAKNLICHPAQARTITATTTLVSAGENSWPITNGSTHNYDAITGRITQLPGGGGSTFIRMEASGAANAGAFPIFSDPSHNYAGVLWFYVPASQTATNATLLSKGGGVGNSSNSLAIYFDGTSNVLRVARPRQADTGIWNNGINTAALAAGVHRIAFGWETVAGTWRRYGLLNQATAVTNNGAADTFATGTNGINLPGANTTWELDLFGNIGNGYFNFTSSQAGIYRFYVENMTQSGRTREAMWAADWAFAANRFTEPTP